MLSVADMGFGVHSKVTSTLKWTHGIHTLKAIKSENCCATKSGRVQYRTLLTLSET